jgi:hypothetical protein
LVWTTSPETLRILRFNLPNPRLFSQLSVMLSFAGLGKSEKAVSANSSSTDVVFEKIVDVIVAEHPF